MQAQVIAAESRGQRWALIQPPVRRHVHSVQEVTSVERQSFLISCDGIECSERFSAVQELQVEVNVAACYRGVQAVDQSVTVGRKHLRFEVRNEMLNLLAQVITTLPQRGGGLLRRPIGP